MTPAAALLDRIVPIVRARLPAGVDTEYLDDFLDRDDYAPLVQLADIIKIDCEGAEFDILESIPESVLDTVKVIVGEFHGTHNDDIKAFLERQFKVNWEQTHERSAEPDGGGIGVFQAVRKTHEAKANCCGSCELVGV